jgi:hypothetical protein
MRWLFAAANKGQYEAQTKERDQETRAPTPRSAPRDATVPRNRLSFSAWLRRRDDPWHHCIGAAPSGSGTKAVSRNKRCGGTRRATIVPCGLCDPYALNLPYRCPKKTGGGTKKWRNSASG